MKAFLASVAISFGLLSAPVLGADKGSSDEAIAMVKKAAAKIKAEGKEKAYAAFADPNNKDFHDRDLYIFVYDLNGVNVAHGNNPKMVGKNLLDLKDVEGKPLIRQMVDIAKTKGNGWVEYKWPNPVTKSVEAKSSYVERVEDVLVGAGIYK
jgi:signal transduction histidine kinase